jgi:RND family efflux transporter MFP subunit
MRASPGLTAVLAVVLAACGDGGTTSGAPPRRPTRVVKVVTAPVATRPLSYRIDAVGSLEAYQTVTVPARVEGVVESLAFEVGDPVTPEKVLAVVDGERYRLEREQAQAAVAKAEAAVLSAEAAVEQANAKQATSQANLSEAQANLARRRDVLRRTPGTVSEEEVATWQAQVARHAAALDEGKALVREASALVTQAKAAVQDAQAGLSLARKDERDAEVRSPITGTVESKEVATGQYVHVGDAVATLVDTRTLRLRFKVSEPESVRLTKASPITFRTSAAPRTEVKATLLHVNGTADPTTRMVECLATVVDPDPSLKPGFFASVGVETGASGAAVVVPEESILPTDVGFVAFVVEAGKAKRRPLSLGLRTKDGQVEVVSGLLAGEALVVEGQSVLADGTSVEVAAPGGATGASGAPPRPSPAGTAPDAPK